MIDRSAGNSVKKQEALAKPESAYVQQIVEGPEDKVHYLSSHTRLMQEHFQNMQAVRGGGASKLSGLKSRKPSCFPDWRKLIRPFHSGSRKFIDEQLH